MRWISALQLETWAETLDARAAFPALISDLIRASAKDIQSFRFPSGDKGQVRGFDGALTAAAAGPFVPGGRSIWEFGVSKGAQAKAESDYNKRTKEVSLSDRAETAFVFASPRVWDNPRIKIDDWVNEKKDRSEWRDVRYIDGAALEHWFDNNPAVAAQYARKELGLIPPSGVRSTDEFWDDYSARFRPSLAEDVLLAERQDYANRLINQLAGDPGPIYLAADSPDEVVAFAVAAIRKAEPELRLFLEARTLILDNEEVAYSLRSYQNLVFLPRGQAGQKAGMLSRANPTLVAIGRDSRNLQKDMLPRPTSMAMGKAIVSMGLGDNEGYELARRCGRSVTILERLIPGGPGSKPDWVTSGEILLPALLAGGWNVNFERDRAAISQLCGGNDYDDYEGKLRPYTILQDPPLDRVQDVWKIRAPVDAFVHLGHLLGARHFENFRAVASLVFADIPKPPGPNDLFRKPPDSKAEYSEWLRDGLATTLLQIASLSEQADLNISGTTPQEYVDGIIKSLPGLTADHRLLASLRAELPLLAEAAPNPLLSALELMLEGDGSAIRGIFDETDDILSPSSDHTGLLWGLEVLAWSPDYLPRVALVLAKLANIDPGGRLSNRPINSLREIFVAWTPNTNAPLLLRLGVIDSIIRDCPDVAWNLLEKLLPQGHDSSSPSPKPKFREAGASECETITYGLIWQTHSEFVSRAMTLATDDPERWITLVHSLPHVEPNLRRQLLAGIDEFLSRSINTDASKVWGALRDEAGNHRAYPDAQWALPAGELQEIDLIVEKHKPAEEAEQIVWLFNDWFPKIPGNDIHDHAVVDQARRDAIYKLHSYEGVQGILALAHNVKLPQFVASSVVDIEGGPTFYEELIMGAVGKGSTMDHFALSVSGIGVQRLGQNWIDSFQKMVHRCGLSAETIATLLLAWPEGRKTWAVATGLGEDVEQSYWTRKGTWIIKDDLDEAQEAAHQYLKFGRAVGALDALFPLFGKLPTELIFKLLDAAIVEVNNNLKSATNMFTYHVEEAFKTLSARSGIPEIDLAKREYAYLPILERRKEALTIHRLLASDPAFYVSVISDVFKAKSDEIANVSEEQKRRAQASYRLLSSFKTLPGQTDQGLEITKLRYWITEVRRRAHEADRSEIIDQYIGHILAHSMNDLHDMAWPDRAVREVLEKIASETVERGIMIERFNMRGVFSKALYEGGRQERALASQARDWAKTTIGWPRTAAMLSRIADDWERHAKWEDVRSEQDRLRS